ncbi:MAG: ABC transporter permease subunit [Phycisphaerales bacterium]|nr:ABC transporter permease subunit [Planctomycetota bacterium]MCH8507349.1 ABC transporter permease subunit [Phycisphaerales bacterium]
MSAQAPVVVGSKNFTEQEILAEIIAGLIERGTDRSVRRRLGLGGTDVCHAALLGGQIDIYPEYTGTGLLNVLRAGVIGAPGEAYLAVASAYRERYDLVWLAPIGFNNTYAITVRSGDADARGWTRISDLLTDAEDLRAGFTAEFMERPDGYPGLRAAYGYGFGSSSDLDPGLMYQALADGQVDVICAFATDGRIEAFDLRVLEDDLGFFPPYDAAPVVRGELLRADPSLRAVLALLAGAISDDDMRRMNHAVDVLGRDPRAVAAEWVDARIGLGDGLPGAVPGGREGLLAMGWRRRAEVLDKTGEHLVLTALGTGIAVLIGVPLGVLIHRWRAARAPVLAMTEIVQTIPSLAMLAFLFAIYGLLGTAPAVTALVLYALLPIVLNTFTGLRGVPAQVVEAAVGVGMSGWQRLRLIELPLAAPVIIAGVRAATVLTVGIATLSTYIGAGGLGDFIARGLARNDTRLTLLGAIPAAVMAVTLSLLIRLVERRMSR